LGNSFRAGGFFTLIQTPSKDGKPRSDSERRVPVLRRLLEVGVCEEEETMAAMVGSRERD
jgi:hypothetical protein